MIGATPGGQKEPLQLHDLQEEEGEALMASGLLFLEFHCDAFAVVVLRVSIRLMHCHISRYVHFGTKVGRQRLVQAWAKMVLVVVVVVVVVGAKTEVV